MAVGGEEMQWCGGEEVWGECVCVIQWPVLLHLPCHAPPVTAENAVLQLQLTSASEQQEVEVGQLQSELTALHLQMTDQKTQFEEVRGRSVGVHALSRALE